MVIVDTRSSTKEYFNEFSSYLTEHCVSEKDHVSLVIVLDIVHHLRRKRPTVFQVLDLSPFSGGQGKENWINEDVF